MTSRVKQIIFVSIFIGIFIALISGAYFLFFYERPSCFDGIKNQNEEGVDCGGACGNICVSSIKPVELTGAVATFDTGPNRSAMLFKIQNYNVDLSAKSFDYTFNIYGGSDEILKTVSGESFIYARELKYIFIPHIEVPANKISRAEFKFQNPDWLPAGKFIAPNVSIQNQKAEVASSHIEVLGNVVNQDLTTMPKVMILSVFFGKFGQEAGASQTEIESLRIGESRPFVIIYPDIEGIDLLRTQVFVYALRP